MCLISSPGAYSLCSANSTDCPCTGLWCSPVSTPSITLRARTCKGPRRASRAGSSIMRARRGAAARPPRPHQLPRRGRGSGLARGGRAAAPRRARMMLAPALLARLGPLQVRARKVMEGVLTGLHQSPVHGQSVEFAEHKEYAPGDEIRHIDWRAYAKLDKYYVKRFEMETNLRALLVVDGSGSMAYGR